MKNEFWFDPKGLHIEKSDKFSMGFDVNISTISSKKYTSGYMFLYTHNIYLFYVIKKKSVLIKKINYKEVTGIDLFNDMILHTTQGDFKIQFIRDSPGFAAMSLMYLKGYYENVTMGLDKKKTDPELYARTLHLIKPKQMDSAVRDACVVLENRIRTVLKLDKSYYGKRLIKAAFDFTPSKGPLNIANGAEREAYYNLMLGINGYYRNPVSHRLILMNDEEGLMIIRFINLLLKKIDLAKKKLPSDYKYSP